MLVQHVSPQGCRILVGVISMAILMLHYAWCGTPSRSIPPAVECRRVHATGTVRHKAEVQSESQREKLCSDMSQAPLAAVQRQRQEVRCDSTTRKAYHHYTLVGSRIVRH